MSNPFRFAPSVEVLDDRLNLSPLVGSVESTKVPDAAQHVRHRMFAVVDRTQLVGGTEVSDSYYGKGVLRSQDGGRTW